MNTIFGKPKTRAYNQLTMEEGVDAIPFFSYPRPQLKRDSFLSLNGKWDDGALVPFPLGSVLSGVSGETPSKYTYHRRFEIPESFIRDRILLHFGAVDCMAKVYVDDIKIGEHAGGYLPFSFDITAFGAGEHALKVEISDDTSPVYPYGKQTLKPGGMWYTPIAGIWGSVWLESVPEDYIRKIRFTPSLNDVKMKIEGGIGEYRVRVYDKQDPAEGTCIIDKSFPDKSFAVDIPDPKLWSPETPNLYGLIITSGEDEVSSYFALREVSIRKIDGYKRICLNGDPHFFHGVLDHAKETIDHLYDHPCICYYTIFNEGWGQFDSDNVYEKVKEWDPTRIIDSTSGWFKQKKSDVESIHCYFKPIRPVESDKPIVVSEMGGYSIRIPGHYFNKTDNYGYRTFENPEDLTEAIVSLYENEVIPYIPKGLCGSIYTQLSDVEDETNGFYTYDRRVCKVDPAAIRALAAKVTKIFAESCP